MRSRRIVFGSLLPQAFQICALWDVFQCAPQVLLLEKNRRIYRAEFEPLREFCGDREESVFGNLLPQIFQISSCFNNAIFSIIPYSPPLVSEFHILLHWFLKTDTAFRLRSKVRRALGIRRSPNWRKNPTSNRALGIRLSSTSNRVVDHLLTISFFLLK